MNNLINSDAFSARCNMIVVPISTEATISSSFLLSLAANNIVPALRKTQYELGEIEIHKIENSYVKLLVFACSVQRNASDYSAISELGTKIGTATKRFRSIKTIGMPLLGSGAGNLDHFKCLSALFTSFYQVSRLDAELIFCVPDNQVFDSLKTLVFTTEGVNIFRIKEIIIKNQRSKAKKLDLGNCGIRDLSLFPELFDCTHLTELILSNEWGEYINGRFIRRKSSNTGLPNILTDLPEGFKKLITLRTLICGGNWNTKKIGPKWSIPDISILSNLNKLITLNVSNNSIENVGNINRLVNLQRLYLNNNIISSMPDLSNLRLLTDLNLSNNKLSSVEFLKNSISLQTIDLHSNKITNLTPIKNLLSNIGIEDAKWTADTINIAQNPLEIPTLEIIVQGTGKILAYFKQLQAEKSIELKPYINRDIKLILVGNSNAGKSTLLHWLKYKEVKKDIITTHWMVLENWQAENNGKRYTVRIFDFGGQEYYHDTHHLFFTDNTTYIVLWEELTNRFDKVGVMQDRGNGRLEPITMQTFPLTYWLESINFHTKRKIRSKSEKEVQELVAEAEKDNEALLARQPRRPPDQANLDDSTSKTQQDHENILIAQNKVDDFNKKILLDQASLKKTYSKISDFLAISILHGKGVHHLNDSIFQVFDSIPIIGKEYPGTWGIIKEKIQHSRFDSPFSLQKFKDYCNEIINALPQLTGKNKALINRVIFSDVDAQSFAQFLNEIGILLYYPDNEELKDKIFLNQDQILKNIYNVLIGLNLTQGKFTVQHAAKQLDKSVNDEEVKDTIRLMLYFKIIFEHPSTKDVYIAPLYLPKDPIESIKIFIPLFHHPVYRYEYKKFIHKNIILDFFNRFGNKAMKESNSGDNHYYWKDGIVMRDEATCEIIMVKFNPATKKEQLAFTDVYCINTTESTSFLGEVVKALDEINEDWNTTKAVTLNGYEFIPLHVIHEQERDEHWAFTYEKAYYKLIDFKKYLSKPTQMKKIFISYSKTDLSYVNKFIEHLSALQLDGKVAHWYCSDLLAGTTWDKTIQKHFDEADIICFMISPNFMKTKYIHEHEIENAFQRKKTDPNFKIVPIILDFCRWNTVKNDLSQFTALPYTAKPIADFDNQNMAWYVIQECLRLMVDKDLDPQGDDFYTTQLLPADLQKIYARIVAGKVDKNSA